MRIEFDVHVSLPEKPEFNLMELVATSGFISPHSKSQEREEDLKAIQEDLADYLIGEGIVPEERRDDLVFKFN